MSWLDFAVADSDVVKALCHISQSEVIYYPAFLWEETGAKDPNSTFPFPQVCVL